MLAFNFLASAADPAPQPFWNAMGRVALCLPGGGSEFVNHNTESKFMFFSYGVLNFLTNSYGVGNMLVHGRAEALRYALAVRPQIHVTTVAAEPRVMLGVSTVNCGSSLPFTWVRFFVALESSSVAVVRWTARFRVEFGQQGSPRLAGAHCPFFIDTVLCQMLSRLRVSPEPLVRSAVASSGLVRGSCAFVAADVEGVFARVGINV